jgi:hypothetical protein
MSVTRDSENDEDLTNIISNSTASTTAATPPINNTAAQQKPISLTSNQGNFLYTSDLSVFKKLSFF